MTRSELLEIAKPILFNTEMVRAILDGRKTATRRVLKPHNAIKAKKCEYKQGSGLWYDDTFNEGDKDTHIKDYSVSCCWIGTKIYIQKYAPYKVGDYLYVRETWCKYSRFEDDLASPIAGTEKYYYRADGENPTGFNTFLVQKGGYDEYSDYPLWHPSIHMPKEAARIFLRVTDVRVERFGAWYEFGYEKYLSWLEENFDDLYGRIRKLDKNFRTALAEKYGQKLADFYCEIHTVKGGAVGWLHTKNMIEESVEKYMNSLICCECGRVISSSSFKESAHVWQAHDENGIIDFTVKDIIGINKKLLGRERGDMYLCVPCLAEFAECSEVRLGEMVHEFKEQGCELF